MIILADSDGAILHYAGTVTAQALARRLADGEIAGIDGDQTLADLTETLDRLRDRLFDAGYTYSDATGWEMPNRAQRRSRPT